MDRGDSPDMVPGHMQLALLGAVAWLTRAEHLLLEAKADESNPAVSPLVLAAVGMLALRRRFDHRVASLAPPVAEPAAPVAPVEDLRRLLR